MAKTMMTGQQMKEMMDRSTREGLRWNHWEAALGNLRAAPYIRSVRDRKFIIRSAEEIRPIVLAAQDYRRDIANGVINPNAFSLPLLYSSREVSIHIDRLTRTKHTWFTESQYCFDIVGPFYEQWEKVIGLRGMGIRFIFIALPEAQIDDGPGVDLTVGFIINERQLVEVDDETLRRAFYESSVRLPPVLYVDWDAIKFETRPNITDVLDGSAFSFGIPPHLFTDIP